MHIFVNVILITVFFFKLFLVILIPKTPVSIFSFGHVSWHIVQHCVEKLLLFLSKGDTLLI